MTETETPLPTLSRADLLLIAAIGRGKVTETDGVIVRRMPGRAINRRCERSVRRFVELGLARLGPDRGTYELTELGHKVNGSQP